MLRHSSCPVSAHPRLRGEHPQLPTRVRRTRGSSPLTRGARDTGRDGRHPPGLIPAYAGSTNLSTFSVASLTAHPRLRGEHV